MAISVWLACQHCCPSETQALWIPAQHWLRIQQDKNPNRPEGRAHKAPLLTEVLFIIGWFLVRDNIRSCGRGWIWSKSFIIMYKIHRNQYLYIQICYCFCWCDDWLERSMVEMGAICIRFFFQILSGYTLKFWEFSRLIISLYNWTGVLEACTEFTCEQWPKWHMPSLSAWLWECKCLKGK